ncbi:unnamed protein product [Brassica oleracea]
MTIRRLRPTCPDFESTKSLNPQFQRRRDVWSVWVVAPGRFLLLLHHRPLLIQKYLRLRIYRGTHSSEFSEGSVPRKFPMKIPRNISSELPRIGPSESPSKYPEEVLPRYIPRSFPTNWWSSEFLRKFISSEFRRKFPKDFRGKMNFRGVISEDLFRRYVVGITLFGRYTDDFFPRYVAVFL